VRNAGALRVGAEFLSRFLPPTHKGVSVYVADPTYVNHLPIFKLNGFEIKRYRYYDPNTNGLDLKGFVEDLQVCAPAQDPEAPPHIPSYYSHSSDSGGMWPVWHSSS
jgi:aspartate/tyrosine/aromatic aminotransferase